MHETVMDRPSEVKTTLSLTVTIALLIKPDSL